MKNFNSNRVMGFFKDSNGKLAVWQWPNVPLIGWMLFKVFSIILSSPSIKNWSENLSTAFLFTWAYLEITGGTSYFRRFLGVLVMVASIVQATRP